MLTTRIRLGDVVIIAEWEGGEYIDLRLSGRTAAEVINVWDHAAGKARIPFTQEALSRHVRDWAQEYDEERSDGALLHDITHNWYA